MRYTHTVRPKKTSATIEAEGKFYVSRGYVQVAHDSPMRQHLEDWMVPVGAYPNGLWVPVWIHLLWVVSGGPSRFKRSAVGMRYEPDRIVSLLMSELLKRQGVGQDPIVPAIKGCLAKYR